MFNFTLIVGGVVILALFYMLLFPAIIQWIISTVGGCAV